MAASIAKMNVQIGWQGKQAENGLKGIKKSIEDAGKAASGASGMFGSLAASLKGANDIKGFLDMSRGVFQYFVMTPINAARALLEMGGQLEQSQIRMAYAAGSWKEGVAILDDLRKISEDTGAPLESLTKGFQQLTSTGLSAGAVRDLLRDTAAAADLLGGGAAGTEKLSSSLLTLASSTTATDSAIMGLQQGGLKVLEALAASLSRIRGQAVTTSEALQALRSGQVLGGTAIQAVQDAANAPGARDAAERFRSSYLGKIAEIKETASAAFADMGKALVDNLKITEVLSGIKGGLSAVRDIISEIVKTIGEMTDPLAKSDGIKGSFEAAQEVTYKIAETIAKAAVDFVTAIKNAANFMEQIADQIAAIVKGGIKGWTSGSTSDEIERIRAMRSGDRQLEEADATVRKRGITDFFEKLRETARAAKEAAEKNKALAAAGDQARAALEANRKAAQEWSATTLRETATPLEKFQESMQALRTIAGQAAQSGVDISKALGRRAAGAISELLTGGGMGDSWKSDAALKGTASAVEAELRMQFGDESKDLQTRIKDAVESQKAIQEKQLQIQQRQLEALSKIPGMPALAVIGR
jgi:hypothetical protein